MVLSRRSALAGLGLAPFLGHIQEAKAQDALLLQTRLSALRQTTGTPAMALGWQRKGQSARIIADGLRVAADFETPVQTEDRWHLGSLSKSMTATLAAILVESGRIDWTTRINTGLPQSGSSPYAKVTLLQLLSHRSGLPHDLPVELTDSFSRDPVDDPISDRRRFALAALSLPPASDPGYGFMYSNLGYIVAAAMLEARLVLPWETLIQDAVFTPLGLESAGFGPPAIATPPDSPFGHQIFEDGRRLAVTLDNPVAMNPAGRVHMSLPDLLTYLAAHRDETPRLLGRESWRMLHRVHFGGDYALGWVRLPDGRLWHNGSNGLWDAEAMIGPRLVAAFAANDAATKSGQPGALIRAATAG